MTAVVTAASHILDNQCLSECCHHPFSSQPPSTSQGCRSQRQQPSEKNKSQSHYFQETLPPTESFCWGNNGNISSYQQWDSILTAIMFCPTCSDILSYLQWGFVLPLSTQVWTFSHAWSPGLPAVKVCHTHIEILSYLKWHSVLSDVRFCRTCSEVFSLSVVRFLVLPTVRYLF